MKASFLDPWGKEVFFIAGAFALAVWCIYWDLRRHLPSAGGQEARPPVQPRSSGKRAWRLEVGIALLAVAWLLSYLSQGWSAWLEAAGYIVFIAGAALVASHIATRLSSASGGTNEG
jgi:hypothetical protein